MRYVIIRDDDTNALTPVECLERLYRPFLDRGFPVNLAVIPNVRTDVKISTGEYEGFLWGRPAEETLPIGTNIELIHYLKANPEYRIIQHGCYHDYFEFDEPDAAAVRRRLEHGRTQLQQAGLGAPRTFVAPYDKLSRVAMREVAARFEVLSTGWFELGRLPLAWWPQYVVKKTTQQPHWRVNGTVLLSHPGCLLSCHRDYGQMLDTIKETIAGQQLTVLVTHWWEYFRRGLPDDAFIRVLHETAEFLESDPDTRVISFDDIVDSRLGWN
jgi:Uncharacterized protein conserved in bacteria (DUF2334)